MPSPKGRILCTEDDADTRDLIVFVLGQIGFEVICADSAEKALGLAKSESFDLYLLDNWLPDTSGTVLTKQPREFDSLTPILFCSGAAFERDKEAAILSGAQGYLVKPIDVDCLSAEVVRLIAGSK
jgi:DNA-binding response OmpR family regulator